MSRPIILWDTLRHTTQTSDEAGTTISKSVHHPVRHLPAPQSHDPRVYVPSLAYYALKSLFEYPEQVHALGSLRLQYRPPSSPLSYDVLRELIPFYDPSDPSFSLAEVDPRLWATIIQVFSDLPDTCRTYRIPLSDKHVPLLQQIPSTPHFSLITILELPGCPELTDETIIQLKCLPGLCALDASATELSTYGVKNLSRTLMWSEDDSVSKRRGPWAIRILNLQNCLNIDNGIFNCLPKFVLLSVIDLRGTQCNPNTCDTKTFRPSSNKSFFHPTLLSSSLALLSTAALSDLPIFSSPELYTLHIVSLNHELEHQTGHGGRRARLKPPVNMQDAYVVFPPSQSYTKVKKEPSHPDADGRDFGVKQRIKVGNSHTLERRRLRREEMDKHEKNMEAWYERNDHWARDSASNWPAGYENPYDEEEMHLSMDEDDMLSEDEDEDESEDDGLDEDSSDGMEFDPSSLCARPLTDVPTSTLSSRANSNVSEGVSSSTSESSSGEQPSASISLSSRLPVDRPVAIPNLPEPQPLGYEYRRLPRAQTRPSDIIRSHPIDDIVSERRLIMSSDGNTELHRQSNRPTLSTVLDVRRMQAPQLAPTPRSDPPRSTSILLTPVTQPSLPDIDIQTSVAAEEARIDATRQAAATFYLDAPVGTTSSSSRTRQRPSYPSYQRRSGTTRAADEQLMLFRDPPPWSSLEDTRIATSAADTKGKQHAQKCAAVLGRSSTTGAAGMDELLQMIKRRKLSETTSTTTKVSNQPKTNSISKNPFRKNPKDLVHAPAQNSTGKRSSSVSRPPLATVSATARLNLVVDGPGRPYKRISTLPVPVLPELRSTQAKVEVHAACKGQSLTDDKRKQASVTRTDSATNTSLTKKSIKKVKPANVELKTRYQGPLPNLLQATADSSAPSQNPRISIKSSDTSKRKARSGKGLAGPTPFDWKGWSDK